MLETVPIIPSLFPAQITSCKMYRCKTHPVLVHGWCQPFLSNINVCFSLALLPLSPHSFPLSLSLTHSLTCTHTSESTHSQSVYNIVYFRIYQLISWLPVFLISQYFGRNNPVPVRLLIFILALLLLLVFLVSLYYFHNWKWSTLLIIIIVFMQ